jgi:hypothetical protein
MKTFNYSSIYAYPPDNHSKEEEILLHPHYQSNLGAKLCLSLRSSSGDQQNKQKNS